MKLLLFFFAILLSFAGQCQIAFYDAPTLNKYLKLESLKRDGNYREFKELLIGYDLLQTSLINNDPIEKVRRDTIVLLKSIIKPNPFTDPYVKDRTVKITIAGGSSDTPFSTGIAKAASSIGGLNVTSFADGLAQFLVERFKEELTIAFFQRFKEDLNAAKYNDLRILFPHTYKILNTIDKDIYQFSAYLDVLREAFIKDLTNSYINLNRLLKQPSYQEYFKKHIELKTLIDNAFFFINQYSSGVHPGRALSLYNPELLKFSDAVLQHNIQSSASLLKLFSESLRSKSNKHYWISVDSIDLIINDEIALDMYLGLLYQKIDTISFTDSLGKKNPVQDLLGKFAPGKPLRKSISSYKEFIQKIAADAQEIDEYITAIHKRPKEEVDYNDYYKLFNASLDLLETGIGIIDLPPAFLDSTKKSNIKKQSNKILFVSRTAGELYVDVKTKNYSGGILNLITVLDTVLNYQDLTYLAQLKNSLDTNKLKNQIDFLSKENQEKFIKKIDALYKNIQDSIVVKYSSTRFRKQQDSVFNILKNNLNSLPDYSKKVRHNIEDYYESGNLDLSNLSTLVTQLQKSVIAFDSLSKQLNKLLDSLKLTNNSFKDFKQRQQILTKVYYLANSLLVTNFRLYDIAINKEVREKILRYGTFAANVAQAKDPAQIKAAIQTIALPSGSSAIKRNTTFNVALNAYVGGYAGQEYLPALKENQWANSFGLFAPVGVAFSSGNHRCQHNLDKKPNRGMKSRTLFVSLIDLGAIAAFRFGDDSSKVASEITLENIIAPGLYYFWGLGRCPISIGAGAQLGPQLREVTASELNIDSNYYIRFGLTVAVDIPLLNLYTRSEKLKKN